MALFDFLKRKEEIEKAKKPVEKQDAVSVKKESQKGTKKTTKVEKETKITKEIKGGKNFSYQVIQEPHISEKATILGEKSQYIFKISPDANKLEVKKSIEGIYGVNVVAVNVIKIPKKKRRMGRVEGFKKGYRKAVVTIKEGQTIELF